MLSTPCHRIGLPVLLLTAIRLSAAAAWAEAPPYRLQAVATDEPITLDGRLDEPAWRGVPAATGFTQREPEPGAPASERTEVRVVYSEKDAPSLDALERRDRQVIVEFMDLWQR